MLHLLVRMADTANSTLIQWEATHFSDNSAGSSVFVQKSESGIVRLVRVPVRHSASMEVSVPVIYSIFVV